MPAFSLLHAPPLLTVQLRRMQNAPLPYQRSVIGSQKSDLLPPLHQAIQLLAKNLVPTSKFLVGNVFQVSHGYLVHIFHVMEIAA